LIGTKCGFGRSCGMTAPPGWFNDADELSLSAESST
jgi:hypothetical protein